MSMIDDAASSFRPADVCRALLAALEASEGRRRKRKRDQTPDAFGLSIKRALLRRVVEDDPRPETFEEWLLHYPLTCTSPEFAGPAFAMARAVFEEWRLAHSLGEFRDWLEKERRRMTPSMDHPASATAATGIVLAGGKELAHEVVVVAAPDQDLPAGDARARCGRLSGTGRRDLMDSRAARSRRRRSSHRANASA
jgi:hypothetical protein